MPKQSTNFYSLGLVIFEELQHCDFLTDQGFHLRLKILTTLINDMYHVGFLRRRLRHIIVKKKNRIIEFCVDHGWSCET